MFMINESESQSETESPELMLVSDTIRQEATVTRDRASPLRSMDSVMGQRHRNAISVESSDTLQGTASSLRRGTRPKLLRQYHTIHSAELCATMICAECIKVIRTALDGTHDKTSRRRIMKNMTQQIYL